MAVLGVLLSPGVFRLVRASVNSVREELYVDAARVSGFGQRADHAPTHPAGRDRTHHHPDHQHVRRRHRHPGRHRIPWTGLTRRAKLGRHAQRCLRQPIPQTPPAAVAGPGHCEPSRCSGPGWAALFVTPSSAVAAPQPAADARRPSPPQPPPGRMTPQPDPVRFPHAPRQVNRCWSSRT